MSEPTPGAWGSCPQGELNQLTAALAFRRRLKLATAAGFVLLAAAGVAGAGWLAHSALRPEPTATHDCVPCQSAFPACEDPTH
jgi:hypothetical protein